MSVAEPRRIFAPPEAFSENCLLLDAERLRHLRTVLRLGPGDEFAVTDGAGAEYLARIEHLGRGEGRALVLGRTEPPRESTLEIILAQALPKGDRFALVLEKAVELGVSGVIPVLSRRTVPAGGAVAAAARWRRIAESAVAQSGRTRLPALHPPRPFEALLGDPSLPDVRILLWEQSSENLRGVVDGPPAPRSVLVAIGPEGGWSEQEVQRARRAGFAAVRFGPRTLRTETAGIAALAVLQNRWGDLG
jgi:16S rRNA (uracil1498-N3)-methyltransferase